MNEQRMLTSWYRYAAGQPGSVDSLLRLLRERTQQTEANQQAQFGASDDDWVRLKGFRVPREHHFTGDARRIAEACHLKNPFPFIQALRLAHSLESAPSSAESSTYYRAAFDSDDELDNMPEE